MAKRYSAKLKFQVVTELLTGDKTPGQVAKAYGVHPNTVNAWKKAFLEKGPEILLQDSIIAEYERRIVMTGSSPAIHRSSSVNCSNYIR